VSQSFENAAEIVLRGEAGQAMFRAMKAESDGLPKVGRSGRELGVRIDGPIRDLHVERDGTVEPRTGGMSVALDAAESLPIHRLPRSLGGEGRDPVFAMFTTGVPRTLLVRTDRYPHALVEPTRRCPLPEFESDLASTRSIWSRTHD
jgi:hypothetical protein